MAEMIKTKNYFIDPRDIPVFVSNVIKRLNKAGFKAYVVGGAVRDILLGRAATDWDIATTASNHEITSIFSEIRHFTLKHETVTLVHKGSHYEVTTIRGKIFSGKIIEEDLGHRDFTINAMACDPSEGLIIDPYNGRQDLDKRTIRAVGDPFERFREDPLRLIRAVRISVELGFKIDQNTMSSIMEMAPQLMSAAPERIRDELIKILLVQRPSPGFRLLRRLGLLDAFLPELMEGFLLRQNSPHRYTVFRHILETVDRVEPDLVLRLVALFHDIAKPHARKKINGQFRFFGHAEKSALLAGEIMERLRFSNDMIKKVTNIITHHMVEYDGQWSDGAVRRLMRRVGYQYIELLMSLRRADLIAHGTKDKELNLLSELEKRIRLLDQGPTAAKIRDLALDGKDVMEILNIPPGPEVGKALDFLLERVTDEPELNTEERLTDLLKKMNH